MNETQLLRASHLLTEASATLMEDGAIAWVDEQIIATGSYTELRARFPDAACHHFRNHLVMPGLINAHDHGRGLGTLQMGVPDAPLELWISGLFALRALDPYLVALCDGLTLLAAGVTTTTHQHNPCDWRNLEQELIDTARGYRDAGIRACIGVPLMDQNALSYLGAEPFLACLPTALAAELRNAGFADPISSSQGMIDVGKTLRAAWKNNSWHWLCWGPVGPQWCSDGLLEKIAEEAGDAPVHIHTVETSTQKAYGERIYGETPIAHLQTLGFLNSNVTCAHCVWLSDQDIVALQRSNAKVAHNPSSNLRLRSGIAPILRLRDAGITVGLGLDGQTLNDDQDMWLEMRLARGLAVEPGVAGRALTASNVFSMATSAGAEITGGPLRGLLAPGHAADMIAISLNRISSPYLDSRTGLIEAVFGRAKPADVEAVFVGGRLSVEAFRSTNIDRSLVEEKLAEFLAQSKNAGQVAKESLVAQLLPHYRRIYSEY